MTTRLQGPGASLRPLLIDGEAPISFTKDGDELLVSLTLHDESGAQLLTIEGNELVYSVDPWDVRLEGQRLSVRAGRGKYCADVRFDPPNRISIERGRFLVRGIQVLVHRDRIVLANVNPPCLTLVNCRLQVDEHRVGLAVGELPVGTKSCIHYSVPTRGWYDRAVVANWLRGG